MSLHGSDYADLAKVVLNSNEAQKVLKIGTNDAKVVQKVTPKNFYKNPRFYIIIGSMVTAGATGNYVNLVPFIQELAGIFF